LPEPLHSAKDMISNMTPVLRSGEFVFISTTDPKLVEDLRDQALASFVEDEGMSMLVPVEAAAVHNLAVELSMRCITLNVYSALDGVGLTAAVAAALGQADIPCNMIAAHHHDHVFVPAEMSDQALNVLASLQEYYRQG
jgi:hypothetical protein